MDDKVAVSICCLAYNHEPYIRQCLDGFMMQKTNFKFEVLIHDDASTDHTADIIREYEAKYPDIIKPIFQTENQHSKGVKISPIYLYPRAKGKYIALCEGDDFWNDNTKLQKQFDAMEENPSCYICVHRVQSVNEDGTPRNYYHPQMGAKIKPGIIEQSELIDITCCSWSFQTSSYFFRKIPELMQPNLPEFFMISPIGDTVTVLLMGSKGDAYYLQDIMSCYRRNSISSWSVRMWSGNMVEVGVSEKIISYCKNRIKSFEKFNEYTSGRYAKSCAYAVFCHQLLEAYHTHDYQEVLKKENREYFKKLSPKQKLRFLSNYHFPILLNLYRKTKRKFREKHEK